jgi:hypothetical protein
MIYIVLAPPPWGRGWGEVIKSGEECSVHIVIIITKPYRLLLLPEFLKLITFMVKLKAEL